MNSFGNKVKYFFGLEGEDELDYNDDYEQERPLEVPRTLEDRVPSREIPRNRDARPEQLPVARPLAKLVICKYTPLDHRETTSMIDDIRAGRPVILNFQETEDFVASRIINICEGAAYALDADIMKIASDIYIIVPEGVDLKVHAPTPIQEEEFDAEDDIG